MSFSFPKNNGPLDLSKGQDKPNDEPISKSSEGASNVPSSKPIPSLPPKAPSRLTPLPPAPNAPQKPANDAPKPLQPLPAIPSSTPYRGSQAHQENVAKPSLPNTPPIPEATEYATPEQYAQPPVQETPVYTPEQYAQPPVQTYQPQGTPEVNKKKGFKSKKGSTTKPRKPSSFAGARRKVLIARITIFSILAILVFSGVSSFLPKSSGLSASDGPLIISKVRENLNFTDFPRTAGEGFALGFTKAYLNYDPTNREPRLVELANYASPEILSKIDMRPATKEEIAKVVTDASEEEEVTPEPEETTNVEGEAVINTAGTQVITDGPYLVGSKMFKGGEAAVFTTKTKINDKSWLYMQIPMFYDSTTGSISVSGSPTFVNPIDVAKVPSTENSYTWTSDNEVAKAITADMTNYMKAWAASDTPTLERLTVKRDGKNVATPEAMKGLDNKVALLNLEDLSVEGKGTLAPDATASDKADFYTRQAQITVRWLEPSSGIVYSQTYRLVLNYVNDDWFVEDIQSVSSLVDRDAIAASKNK